LRDHCLFSNQALLMPERYRGVHCNETSRNRCATGGDADATCLD